MKQSLILFVLIFGLLPTSHAYILRAQTIVKNMTRNNGSQDYTIVREVTLESENRQVKAREVWTVANGDKMKVKVSSLDSNNAWNFAILYDSRQRRTLSSTNKIKTFKRSNEFFEPLFHDRYYKSLMKRLVHYRFVPSWAQNTAAPDLVKGKTLMTPEPFVGLEPMEGTVSYAIGADKSSDGSSAHTQLWVEQDSFNIIKGRLPSKAEFVNSKFQSFPGGLKLPSEQQVTWNNKVAKVKLLAVERAHPKTKDWALEDSDSGSLPVDPLIKEFYTRFR